MEVIPDLLERIRGEFIEMPGLKLSIEQACRLWNLKQPQCQETLDALIAEGFLLRTASGAFIAAPSAGRMVKAAVPEDRRRLRCPSCQYLNSVPLDSTRRQPGGTTFRCAACAKLVSIAAASA